MAVTAAKSVMAFRVLTMAVDLCRLTTRTMNVNAGHERTSKARIIHQIQLIRGITQLRYHCQLTSPFGSYEAASSGECSRIYSISTSASINPVFMYPGLLSIRG
ncbi:Transposase (plasmid) [Shigella dysenteriae 1617]|uniref:Transposase n=1 Tax=Shigella dysenteriae 1617 TaxID=754093 RepID=A0A0A7A4R4_SHIDY|nr:Transposase [Shigella dysenteriae 1617]